MLYQEARPESFEEVAGNDGIKIQLLRALEQTNHPHAFLFYGPTGCGKTTLARIVASIVSGNNQSAVIEINSAQARGIDTVRQVQKEQNFLPLGGGNRIVIFDEAHGLTSQAQNCLLKILEDIPAHQYYILTSTVPEKIITTIRNRCAQFGVSNLKDVDMTEVITMAAEKWNKLQDKDNNLTVDVINFIITAAAGCPRRAVMLVEQVITLSPNEAADAIQRVTQETTDVKILCKVLLTINPSRENLSIIKKFVKLLSQVETEPETIRRQILGYMEAVIRNSDSIALVESAMNAHDKFIEADTFRNGKYAIAGAAMALRN